MLSEVETDCMRCLVDVPVERQNFSWWTNSKLLKKTKLISLTSVFLLRWLLFVWYTGWYCLYSFLLLIILPALAMEEEGDTPPSLMEEDDIEEIDIINNDDSMPSVQWKNDILIQWGEEANVIPNISKISPTSKVASTSIPHRWGTKEVVWRATSRRPCLSAIH